jgi:predicted GTPase
MANARKWRVVIIGAAGRDFQNFNTVYKTDERTEVVAFTATQIPGIASRRYPASLAGKLTRRGFRSATRRAWRSSSVRGRSTSACSLTAICRMPR